MNQHSRTLQPVSALNIALQCGGSDAFSGISGNPLAGGVAKEVIRQGGAANLAETDELLGAEPYILQKVSDLKTAQKFVFFLDRFIERAKRHGSSAAGNPSGGNKFRGAVQYLSQIPRRGNEKRPRSAARSCDRIWGEDGRARVLFHG